MTGDNFNKKSGQTLLIIILFITMAVVVALSISFKTVTDAQLTKSQEDSLVAVAAADSAVELGFRLPESSVQKTFRELGLTQFNKINIDKSTLRVSSAPLPDYITPVIPKDGQYTLYWAAYGANTLGQSAPPQTVKMYYGSSSSADCNKMGFEFTLITGDLTNPAISKKLADTGNLFNSGSDQIGSTNGGLVKEINFACSASLAVPTNTKLIIVRYLAQTVDDGDTRLGFTPQSGLQLPAQGKIVRADVVSLTGVKKIVESVQTYPQIPVEFFTTTL